MRQFVPLVVAFMFGLWTAEGFGWDGGWGLTIVTVAFALGFTVFVIFDQRREQRQQRKVMR